MTMHFPQIRIPVNGIEMNVVVTGEGPDVLLLHGFPDTHAIWRHQIPALMAAGYRVIAPDLRGCGLTEMPPKVSDYKLRHLVADVIALLDALHIDQVRLVAHDWGAVIGWQVALQHPNRVERYVAMAVGHPDCYATGGVLQKLKGYYIVMFQLRGFAEWFLRLFNWAPLQWLTRCPQEMAQWRSALSPVGRLTAGINYYRANLQLILPLKHGLVNVPVMGVFATKDIALVESQMTRSEQLCKNGWRYERLAGVGHWMTVEAPETINPLLLDYLH